MPRSYGTLSDVDKEREGEKESECCDGKMCLSFVFFSCLLVGPVNFLVYKVMYSAFGDGRAFFVSQGVNFLYVLYGGVILRAVESRGEITPEMRQIPHYKFLIMGTLDALGGFLAAMGAVHTSGPLQQLLNQTLIPITMFFSWSMLGRGSSTFQVLGAFIIMVGAWVVLLPSSTAPDANAPVVEDKLSFLSNMLYIASNIPIALSCVYKEKGFAHMHVHVIYLTQMVSIYQLLVGFVLGLLQVFPGVGTVEGSSIAEITNQFISGVKCYLFMDAQCREDYTFFLLTGYCVLNFVFNTTGLYLVKHDSAVLSTLTNALVLPLTCLAFSFPMMGKYREPFDFVTLFGLCIVLSGFAIWRLSSLTWIEALPLTNENLEKLSEEQGEQRGIQFDRICEEDLEQKRELSVLSCYGYVPKESRVSRTRSFDSTGSAPDAFYDRCIVLSLNHLAPEQ